MTGLGDLRWQDAVDVVLITLVLYRVYLWLRGTLALQIAVGMLTLVAAAYAASQLGLLLTAYLLQGVSAVAVLVMVVIFRDEIRRALGRASPLRLLLPRRPAPPPERRELTPLSDTLFILARHRIGALVVLPRQDPLRDQVTGGVSLDALLTGPLIETIFHKDTALHDGAVVVLGDRVIKAGTVLPLPQGPLPLPTGTRHAAAVGLTEVTDALVIVVSEERGTVMLAEHGLLTEMPDAPALARRLAELMGPSPNKPATRWRLVQDGLVGGLIFVGVVAAWNIVANSGNAEEDRQVPVELRGSSAGLRLEAVPGSVTLRLRGPRRLLIAAGNAEVHAFVDLARNTGEATVVGIAPPGVEVVGVHPPRATLLERRTLRVEPQLAAKARLLKIEPATVTLVGKVGSFKGIDTVKTRPVDASGRVELVVPPGLYLADDRDASVDCTLAPSVAH
jgi:diadenylate cyclase